MQYIAIDKLKPHPRNEEFFDDITGDKWEEFKQSISSFGVREPIIITQDNVIVSGHQRVRACKELGITEVPYEQHTYSTEEEVIRDLIEVNIRQRGDVGGSARKIGARIKALESAYGIQHGATSFQGNQHKEVKPKISASPQKTQKDLAEELGISLDTLQNYKLMAEMIPELDDLLETGIVTKSTVLAMMKELTPTEQADLISSLDTTKKITQKQMEEAISSYKKEIADAKATAESTKEQYAALQERIRELKNKPVEVIHEEPEDYSFIKEENASLKEQTKQLTSDLNKLKKQLKEKPDTSFISEDIETIKRACEDTTKVAIAAHQFITTVGGMLWLGQIYKDLSESKQNELKMAIEVVDSWVNQIKYNIGE